LLGGNVLLEAALLVDSLASLLKDEALIEAGLVVDSLTALREGERMPDCEGADDAPPVRSETIG